MVTTAEAKPSGRTAPAEALSVLLVGASRGLGLGLAKSFAAHGWNVVATERTAGGSLKAAAAAYGRIRIEQLDINETQQVQKLHRRLSGDRFDVIFIVAGVKDDPTKPIHQVPVQEAARVFITNAYSPMYFAEMFLDRLKPGGTLAIMTSRMGSVELASTYVDGGWEAYRASKAALNMLARCFYLRHRDEGHTIVLVHPGWVKTDMGGEDAPVELAESVNGVYGVLQKWRGSGRQVFVDYEGNVLPW
jgi:NAD(P)-dependent dehydrogenase (short-subunit alcohol dehydrogenase family)